MKPGGVAPLVGVGLAAAAIMVVIAAATHGFQQVTGCAAYAVAPTVTVKISGNATDVAVLQVCASDEPCVTAPRTGEATPGPGPASQSSSGSAGTANATFVPVFLDFSSSRPRVWVFDVGTAEPAAITVTAKNTLGKVLARKRYQLAWHSADTDDGCDHGNVTDPVHLHL